MSDPDMGNWSYNYDLNGLLTSQTNARSETFTFDYDILSRPITKTYPAGSKVVNKYDTLDGVAVPNGKGRQTAIVHPNVSTKWEFNARGNTTKATYYNITGSIGLAATRVFSWTYNVAQQVDSFRMPDKDNPDSSAGEIVKYSYDPAGRATSLCDTSPTPYCYVKNAQYTALGQTDQWELGNTLIENWNYNSTTQRLSEIKVGTAGTPDDRLKLSYTYDTGGNISAVNNSTNGLSSVHQIMNYTYDHRDRLTSAFNTTGSSFN